MAIKKVKAIVLKRIPVRESSILVTVFSREHGKLRGLVKGVRREKNPQNARFEPFTCLSLIYYEKLRSDTHLITEAVVIDSNHHLRDQLRLFAFASYLVELVDVLFDLYDPYPEIFDLLKDCFKLFRDSSPELISRAFEIKLFGMAGLLPIFNQCVLCRKKEPLKAFFSPKQGGIVCAECDPKEPSTIPISKGTIQSVLFFLKSNMAQAVKLHLSPQSEKELSYIHNRFLQYRLDQPLKTPKFIADIKSIVKA